ncbi:MAG: hypothetical protein QM802_00020 [Agriterribacter sp.]
MSTTNPRGKETRLRVGFIASNIFQLFHYRAIASHLDADVTVYLEARDEDFGLTKEAVDSLMPGCRVTWVASEELLSIDGQCEVLVCQTPVGALTFFTRSLLVAQQYSLAKEQYQYGPWRAQANLNLMYGPYSARGGLRIRDHRAGREPPARRPRPRWRGSCPRRAPRGLA